MIGFRNSVSIISLLFLFSCAEETIRFATHDKSDSLQLANHIAQYFLTEGYYLKVQLIQTENVFDAFVNNEVDIVLEATPEILPEKAIVLGELHEGCGSVKIISSSFHEKHPELSSLIEHMQLPKNKLAWSLSWTKDNEQTWKVGATHFINNNQSRWKKWGMEQSRMDAIKSTLKKDVAALLADKVPL